MQNRSIAVSKRLIAPLVAALLLGLSAPVFADDVQDAYKLYKQGQQSQAFDKIEAVLAAKPKDAQARFLKGLLLTEQGKTAEAIKLFTALTEDYPELPEPYNNLAVLYAGQGQYDKARHSLEMAIRTHPSYATAHENLGDIYAKMASQAYNRALQLDKNNANTQTKLALIQDLFSANSRKPAQPPVVVAQAPQAAAAQPATPAQPPVAAAPATPAAKVPEAKPAEKPVETKPAAKAPANDSDEVVKTVNAWASAWAAQNVKKYLSFYASDFKVPKGESRAHWEASRKERISAPKSIEVNVSKIRVNFTDATHATASFHQTYRASHFKATGNKTLSLVKSGGKWLIQDERT